MMILCLLRPEPPHSNTLSLHDALPISAPADRFRLEDGTIFGVIASTTAPFCRTCDRARLTADGTFLLCLYGERGLDLRGLLRDRKSTRLNSSHMSISYAVFCLKKKPAHVHFTIAAPGYRTLVTQLFVEGDQYLDSDAVFGVKDSLVVDYKNVAAGGEKPRYRVSYDFRLTALAERSAA